MNTIEKNPDNNLGIKTRTFLAECENIVYGYSRNMLMPIYHLDEDEQDKIVDRLNVRLAFEHYQSGMPAAVPVEARGHGLLLACDESGSVLGVEIISDGIFVHGDMSGVVSLPVPSLDSLIASEDGDISTIDQVLSPIAIIENATYKSGPRDDGTFEFEHDLSRYRVGLAMAHPLVIQAAS